MDTRVIPAAGWGRICFLEEGDASGYLLGLAFAVEGAESIPVGREGLYSLLHLAYVCVRLPLGSVEAPAKEQADYQAEANQGLTPSPASTSYTEGRSHHRR